MTDEAVKGPASYFPAIEKKYGRPIAEWQQVVRSRADARSAAAYSPASDATSARDLRPRSVADFSCPQAAMMSSPRGVRIGEA